LIRIRKMKTTLTSTAKGYSVHELFHMVNIDYVFLGLVVVLVAD